MSECQENSNLHDIKIKIENFEFEVQEEEIVYDKPCKKSIKTECFDFQVDLNAYNESKFHKKESNLNFPENTKIKREELYLQGELNSDHKDILKTASFDFQVDVNAYCNDNHQKMKPELRKEIYTKSNDLEQNGINGSVSSLENASTLSEGYASHLEYDLSSPDQEKPFKCEVCTYSSTKKRYLHDHMRIHSLEKRFRCDNCSYATSVKSCLQKHMKIHGGEKDFKCHICSYSSFHRSHLLRHLKVHTGEKIIRCNRNKPYKCEICTFATAYKGCFEEHSRVHSGEKPFKCNLCSFATAYKSRLQQHSKIHTGEKPHKCSICSFATVHKPRLRTHLRTHSGEKPFKCNVCSYASAVKFYLKRHSRIHSKECTQQKSKKGSDSAQNHLQKQLSTQNTSIHQEERTRPNENQPDFPHECSHPSTVQTELH